MTPMPPCPHAPRRLLTIAAVAAALAAATLPAAAALVRPLEGVGQPRVTLDVVDRPAAGGRTDLVLLFSVQNSSLAFREILGGGLTGSLEVAAELDDPTGAVPPVRRSLTLPLAARTRGEAASPTSYQVFSLRLDGVAARGGDLVCTVRDREAERVAVRDGEKPPAPAELRWTWAPADRSDFHGLWLHSPIFLGGAPLASAGVAPGGDAAARTDNLTPFLHPNRRYGAEQERLQVMFDVEAVGLGPGSAARLPDSLLVQAITRDLDFAVRDTIPLGLDRDAFLAAGGLATVTWEFDVNQLPPGPYLLSCAPLGGDGNSWVAEFDVIWNLRAMTRPADELEAVGRVVLHGDQLKAFLKAGRSGREAILAKFWGDLDPDPATPFNAVEEEFRSRMSYVDRFLGGMTRAGPRDDRGLVYLLLGPPDDIEKQVVPINPQDFNDALARVYDSYLPTNHGLVLRDAYTSDEQTTQAIRDRLDRLTSQMQYKAFELWKYKANGSPLFQNQYSVMPLGLNFLFVARGGGDVYSLETTNAFIHSGPSR